MPDCDTSLHDTAMLIVTGSLIARPDTFDEVLRLSEEHVRRSRTEPGCISHAVSRDTENALRLVFFEEWSERAALMAHFAVPASRGFAKATAALVVQPPALSVYEAQPIKL